MAAALAKVICAAMKTPRDAQGLLSPGYPKNSVVTTTAEGSVTEEAIFWGTTTIRGVLELIQTSLEIILLSLAALARPPH